MAYENDLLTLSQDWELPIEGFFVVAPKRHVERFNELTSEERNKMYDIVDKTIKVLRDNNICDRFNVICEEKENVHFHIWIMPRHDWMVKLVGNVMGNIKVVFDYAKTNYRTKEVYENIDKINKIVRDYLR